MKRQLEISSFLASVNNNIYIFLSGIIVSTATGILASTVFAQDAQFNRSFLYLSTIFLLISGGLLLALSSIIANIDKLLFTDNIVNQAIKSKITSKDKVTSEYIENNKITSRIFWLFFSSLSLFIVGLFLLSISKC